MKKFNKMIRDLGIKNSVYFDVAQDGVNAGKFSALQDWLDSLTTAQIETISKAIDDEKASVMSELAAISLLFLLTETGKTSASETELEKAFENVIFSIPLYANVRSGLFKQDRQLWASRGDLASFSLTEQGMEHAKKLISNITDQSKGSAR